MKFFNKIVRYRGSALNKTSKIAMFEFCSKCFSTLKSFEQIPGPTSLPFLGTLYQYVPLFGSYKFDRLHHNGMKKYKKFGPIVKEEIVPGVNLVWLFDPNDIETLFRNEGKYPQRRSHLALEKYRLDKSNVYNTGGLLPTNGPEWFRIRSILQRGLSSPTSVNKFLDGSDDIVQEWMARVDMLIEENCKDYLPEISRLFLEMTCQSIFDIRMESFTEMELQSFSQTSKLIKAAYDTNSCILKLDNGPHLWKKFPTPLYRKFKKSQEYMESVAIDLISLKLSIYKETDDKNSRTLLDDYFASPELDFKDIIGMGCDFLLAGIDTTTYSTCFTLYFLANNEEKQNALFEEAVSLLPNPQSKITPEIMKRCHYAKAVVKESFRLQPISVGIGRVLDKTTVFSGYSVPSETVIVSQNQVSCRLEEHFPKPDEFIPERWIKHDSLYRQPHPFLLLPFGHGPRACIARRLAEQNMIIVILKLIRNYRVTWTGGDLDSKSLLINKPDKPITLKLEKRC